MNRKNIIPVSCFVLFILIYEGITFSSALSDITFIDIMQEPEKFIGLDFVFTDGYILSKTQYNNRFNLVVRPFFESKSSVAGNHFIGDVISVLIDVEANMGIKQGDVISARGRLFQIWRNNTKIYFIDSSKITILGFQEIENNPEVKKEKKGDGCIEFAPYMRCV